MQMNQQTSNAMWRKIVDIWALSELIVAANIEEQLLSDDRWLFAVFSLVFLCLIALDRSSSIAHTQFKVLSVLHAVGVVFGWCISAAGGQPSEYLPFSMNSSWRAEAAMLWTGGYVVEWAINSGALLQFVAWYKGEPSDAERKAFDLQEQFSSGYGHQDRHARIPPWFGSEGRTVFGKGKGTFSANKTPSLPTRTPSGSWRNSEEKPYIPVLPTAAFMAGSGKGFSKGKGESPFSSKLNSGRDSEITVASTADLDAPSTSSRLAPGSQSGDVLLAKLARVSTQSRTSFADSEVEASSAAPKRTTMVIGNLPASATESDIVDAFLCLTPHVSSFRLMRGPDQASRCFGFLKLNDCGAAAEAFEKIGRGAIVLREAQTGRPKTLKADWAEAETVMSSKGLRRESMGGRGRRSTGKGAAAAKDFQDKW